MVDVITRSNRFGTQLIWGLNWPLWTGGGSLGVADPGVLGMSRILTITFSALMFAAPALADTLPEGVTLRAYQPVGNGDPNAISCWAWRTTPPVRGLQCARNSYWARLNGLSPAWFDGPPHQYPPAPSTVWPWESYPNSR